MSIGRPAISPVNTAELPLEISAKLSKALARKKELLAQQESYRSKKLALDSKKLVLSAELDKISLKITELKQSLSSALSEVTQSSNELEGVALKKQNLKRQILQLAEALKAKVNAREKEIAALVPNSLLADDSDDEEDSQTENLDLQLKTAAANAQTLSQKNIELNQRIKSLREEIIEQENVLLHFSLVDVNIELHVLFENEAVVVAEILGVMKTILQLKNERDLLKQSKLLQLLSPAAKEQQPLPSVIHNSTDPLIDDAVSDTASIDSDEVMEECKSQNEEQNVSGILKNVIPTGHIQKNIARREQLENDALSKEIKKIEDDVAPKYLPDVIDMNAREKYCADNQHLDGVRDFVVNYSFEEKNVLPLYLNEYENKSFFINKLKALQDFVVKLVNKLNQTSVNDIKGELYVMVGLANELCQWTKPVNEQKDFAKLNSKAKSRAVIQNKWANIILKNSAEIITSENKDFHCLSNQLLTLNKDINKCLCEYSLNSTKNISVVNTITANRSVKRKPTQTESTPEIQPAASSSSSVQLAAVVVPNAPISSTLFSPKTPRQVGALSSQNISIAIDNGNNIQVAAMAIQDELIALRCTAEIPGYSNMMRALASQHENVVAVIAALLPVNAMNMVVIRQIFSNINTDAEGRSCIEIATSAGNFENLISGITIAAMHANKQSKSFVDFCNELQNQLQNDDSPSVKKQRN